MALLHLHCWILAVSPLILSRNGPVHGEDTLHFIQWCSPWPSEPLCSFRRWLLTVHKAKEARNNHLLCLNASTKALGLAAGFGKWYTAFPGISQTSRSSFAFMTCTLSPQQYFHYLFLNLAGLKPKLEAVKFLCLDVVELEPLINGVMIQNLQCKLGDWIHLPFYVSWARSGFSL